MCEIVIYKLMVTNIGGKLSISRGISSPGKPYLAEEVTCFSFFIPWYGWIELHSHMLLQGPKISYSNRLIHSLPTAMICVIEKYNRLGDSQWGICSPRWKRILKISYLTQSRNEASRILFYWLVRCQWWRFRKILSNMALNQTLLLKKYQGTSSNIFYGLEAYGTH